MKPYGVPRRDNIERPDVADIQNTARAGHVGKFPEKCGKFKPYIRSTENRKAIRRYYKKKIRREGSCTLRMQDDELNSCEDEMNKRDMNNECKMQTIEIKKDPNATNEKCGD